MKRSFRGAESGQMGSLRFKDYKDEDLALFREMLRRKKERTEFLLRQNSDDFDSPLGRRSGSSPRFELTAPVRRNGADEFLNSDYDKTDYDWLLTPPATPLFPSLEMEAQMTVMSQLGNQKARPALKSRLVNAQTESPAGSRPATPTGRSSSKSSLTSSSNKPASTAAVKTNATSATTSRRSRSVTPTRPTSASAKPARSSTPTARSTARSSTPTSRVSTPASKTTTSRASTPTHRPTPSTATRTPAVSSKSSTLSSVVKLVSTAAKNLTPSRSNSPTVRPRPRKASEMPGFSLDASPDLRKSLADRPSSPTGGRPGAPSSRSSFIETVSNRRGRRRSCSPARSEWLNPQ